MGEAPRPHTRIAPTLGVPRIDVTAATPTPARPGRREGGKRAQLESTAEGRALLAEARGDLGEILAADGLVPLAALRLRRGLTQQQLAERSGILQPQLSRIESGAHDIMTATAVRLAAALEVSVGEIAEAVVATRSRMLTSGHE